MLNNVPAVANMKLASSYLNIRRDRLMACRNHHTAARGFDLARLISLTPPVASVRSRADTGNCPVSGRLSGQERPAPTRGRLPKTQ